MLVGLKAASDENGNICWPPWINRGIDTDVIVSEVRETSRKPDEVYGVIERMCPGGRIIGQFPPSTSSALEVLLILPCYPVEIIWTEAQRTARVCALSIS
jgi:hypothetical protein